MVFATRLRGNRASSDNRNSSIYEVIFNENNRPLLLHFYKPGGQYGSVCLKYDRLFSPDGFTLKEATVNRHQLQKNQEVADYYTSRLPTQYTQRKGRAGESLDEVTEEKTFFE